MNEPRRWRDDPTAHEMRALLRHARPPRGIDQETLRRSRLRVAGLAALPLGVGFLTWLPSLALGAVAGAVLGVATLGPPSLAPRAVEEPSAKERAVPRKGAPGSRGEQAPVPVVLPAPVLETPTAEGSATLPPRRAVPSAPARTAASDLANEVALLERARAQLGSEPRAALRVLDQHRREYAQGTLALEREFLAVDALVRSGRHAEARERGTALRSRAPGSLYEQRLDALLSRGKGAP